MTLPTWRWPARWAAQWPAPCLVCQSWCPGGLCLPCLARFAAPRPRCRLCGLALPQAAHPVCGHCLAEPPPVAGTRVALDYGFPWDEPLGRFKFSGQPELGQVLARPLIAVLQAQGVWDRLNVGEGPAAGHAAPRPDWIIPVPLAPERLALRGYNQAGLLARELSRALALPCAPQALRRWRSTAAQSRMAHAADRRRNLQGAFMPTPEWLPRLQGRRVALVDDVMTTGATLFEAARCLRQAGAAEVWCWVLARTPAP